MRIGMVAPPWIPVPAPGYGGIETVVAGTAGELARRGHDVVLVAAPGSDVPGVRTTTPLTHVPERVGLAAEEWAHLVPALSAPRGPGGRHRPLRPPRRPPDGAGGAARAPCRPRSARRCRAGALPDGVPLRAAPAAGGDQPEPAGAGPGLPWAGVAHNGLDLDGLPIGGGRGGYLAFLGRMTPDKGVAEAIAVARAAGMPLRIAAKCREPAEQEYFAQAVEPLLGDDVAWLGELDHAGKIALLADAAALVFPIRWPEPFGMVMIESMAVGTPVLATRCGSVPEVVRDGVTGIVRERPEDLARDVGRALELDRAACREHVRRNFSLAGMTDRHERLLAAACASGSERRRRPRLLRSEPPIGGLPREVGSR